MTLLLPVSCLSLQSFFLREKKVLDVEKTIYSLFLSEESVSVLMAQSISPGAVAATQLGPKRMKESRVRVKLVQGPIVEWPESLFL